MNSLFGMRNGMALIVGTLAYLTLWASLVEGQQVSRRQYRWAELEERVKGRRIEFVQPDGTEVAGKALGVQADGLRMNVKKTSNPNVVGKGIRVIPPEALSIVKVNDTGRKWRIILTIAMPFVVVGAIAAAAGDLPEQGASGDTAVGIGVLGSLAGGYLMGWALDKKTTEIEVVRN